MKRIHLSYISKIALFFYLLSCVSCANDVPTDKPTTPNDSSNVVDSVQLYTLSMEGDTVQHVRQFKYRTEDEDNVYTDSSDITRIVFSYPQFLPEVRPFVADSMNEAIVNILLLNEAGDLAYKNLEDRMDDFISQYKEDLEFSAGLGWGVDMKWVCEVEATLLLNTPRLVSIRFAETNFTGGAHANTRFRYLNFNAETGKVVDLDDLLEGEYDYNLQRLGESYFRKSINLDQEASFAEMDFYFSDGFFQLPEQMGLSDKGIVFHYEPFELGHPSDFVFVVPYHEIEPLLDKTLVY